MTQPTKRRLQFAALVLSVVISLSAVSGIAAAGIRGVGGLSGLETEDDHAADIAAIRAEIQAVALRQARQDSVIQRLLPELERVHRFTACTYYRLTPQQCKTFDLPR